MKSLVVIVLGGLISGSEEVSSIVPNMTDHNFIEHPYKRCIKCDGVGYDAKTNNKTFCKKCFSLGILPLSETKKDQEKFMKYIGLTA